MKQYSTRAMSVRPCKTSQHHILEFYEYICQYCGEFASTVDHIIPFAYGGSDDDDNLVAACKMCNCTAGGKVFDCFEEKRAYILVHTAKKRPKPTKCTECGSLYSHVPPDTTPFLCGHCKSADEQLPIFTKRERTRAIRRFNSML